MRRKCGFILTIILVLFAGCNYYEGPENIGFNIGCTVSPVINGKIIFKNEAQKGETITITGVPDKYYHLVNVLVRNKTSNDLITVSGTGNERTFVMPADPVKITAVSFGLDDGLYSVTMASQYFFGDLTSLTGDRYKVDGYVREGETVTLIIVPEQGYKLDSVKITGKKTGDVIPVTIDNANKRLTFIMPGENVGILDQKDVVFVPIAP